ncbi:hypothetical protein DPMN_105470 [Dreissena polymorpha]|uniref:Uncharacterized protein n=1 Tax=Dreissena polymorpha TaxID=45954 RepID=A0A9D4K345_DREPO|nr:hypothetical protein DPMN_105470 [Dreissena polymorpha]
MLHSRSRKCSHCGDRTLDLQVAKPTPYPLRHGKLSILSSLKSNRVFKDETGGEIPNPAGTPYSDFDEIDIQEEGILKLFKNLNHRKASGPDNISARILKDLTPGFHEDPTINVAATVLTSQIFMTHNRRQTIDKR